MASSAGRYRFAIALLAVCVVSRLITTIHYIEDTDSLRFALSVYDEFDVAGLQPHFPGYPVFWLAARALYVLTGRFAVAFSLIGGLATFAVAIYLLRQVKAGLTSVEGLLMTALVLFCPLMWLMGNRYMPDLMGLAAAQAAFYYLTADSRDPSYGLFAVRQDTGFAICGLLAGIRLSYVPFLIVPAGVAFFSSDRKWRSLAYLLGGVAVWLVPMIADTGWKQLVNAATRQTEGHFTEFGGTIETNPDPLVRLVRTLEAVWADGLGGFWAGRHWLTLMVGAGLIAMLVPGVRVLVGRLRTDRILQLHVAAWFIYFLWMLLFQNVIYKSRHVLPLLPLVIVAVAFGAAELLRSGGLIGRVATGSSGGLIGRIATGAFFTAYAVVGLTIAVQHTRPTAIAQVKTFIESIAPADDTRIVSIPLVNFFLSAQDVDANYVSIEDTAAVRALADGTGPVVVVGSYPNLPFANPSRMDTFYHNPYVNRMWPEVHVHLYDHPK